ncbi:EcoRI family type II restriction endonuclease [Streptococcus dysgalactiae]|uniref:EcoRI family type II restriction endonuclease n=1 Tax=Streptococcus dysgalactiae TaxID=1334 RepID=UPI0023DDC9CD|nr:EcoRI family type II restriction endonuclease [Streptococcus dysgalactiae]
MKKKNQSSRLTSQHKESHGVIGIFGKEAKEHDMSVGQISRIVLKKLEEKYPELTFKMPKQVYESRSK